MLDEKGLFSQAELFDTGLFFVCLVSIGGTVFYFVTEMLLHLVYVWFQ